jgi:hypothetical protein
METFFQIGFFILFPVVYIYLAIFDVRYNIIEKLTKFYVYSDPSFGNGNKYTRYHWEALNYSKFIRKRPVFLAMLKEMAFLVGIPVFAGLFAIFIFGIMPAKSPEESHINMLLMANTTAGYYAFAIIVFIYHRTCFRKYKDKAAMEKNLWEAKSILSGEK